MRKLILLVLLSPALATAQVYKCTDAKGKVVFQETACDANRGANRVNTAPSSGGFEPPPREAAPPKLAAPPGREDALSPGVSVGSRPAPKPPAVTGQTENRRYIKVGMNRAEVIASIGQPDAVRERAVEYVRGRGRVAIEAHEIYEPRAGDDQTRTIVYYVGDQVNEVKREVVRTGP